MALYIVGYDLKAGERYSSLINALNAFPNRWHCLDSTWILETDMGVVALRDHLWQHMYSDDKLLVAHYLRHTEGGGVAWIGFDQACAAWLNNNM